MNSARFAEIRKKLGLSQPEMAQVLGLSSGQAVSNIETGLRNPGKLMGAVMEAFAILPERQSRELRRLLTSILSDEQKTTRRRGR